MHQGSVAGASDGEEARGEVVADVAKLSVGREEYYTRELATDHEAYLSGHGESPGRWYGAGAANLELEGEASVAGFQAMFEGRDPTTEELLGRPHGRDAVPAFDVVLRPTKSVSVLYGLGEGEQHHPLAAAGTARSAASRTRPAAKRTRCSIPASPPCPQDARGRRRLTTSGPTDCRGAAGARSPPILWAWRSAGSAFTRPHSFARYGR